MKFTGPVSAFSVYQKILTEPKGAAKGSISSNMKKKSKLKAKNRGKSNLNELNSDKVLMGIKQDNIYVKTNLTKVSTDKLVNNETLITKSTNPESVLEVKQDKKQKKRKVPKKSIKKRIQLKAAAHIEEKSNSEEMKKVVSENTEVQNDQSKSGQIPDSTTSNPIMKGYQLFEWMISPISPENFFEKYWETKSFHIPRSNKKYYSHLLTSRHLHQIFTDNDLYYNRNVDVVVYENEEKQVLNPEGRANPSALWDFYSNGCSIRVLNPQTYNKKVHLLVSTLQEYFGSMVGANVYLTPPGSQGFAPHFDDIEAFIIQLEGRKHWKLYRPKDEDVLTRHSSKNFKHEEIGDSFSEVTLEAGSLLYFPRGIIHEGRTDPDSHSLHITVSLYQNNAYIDLFEKMLPNALQKAAKSDVNFRKGLPLHFLRSGNAKEIIMEKVAELFDNLKEHLDVDTGLHELGRKLVYDSMPPVLSADEIACSSRQGGELLDNGIVYNRVQFDLSTQIRLTRYHCIQLVFGEDMNPKLYYSTENSTTYHGEEEQWLDLDSTMVPAIEALQKAYPSFIAIGFLPIEGIDAKVQFVYDLWEKGIVITKEPLSG